MKRSAFVVLLSLIAVTVPAQADMRGEYTIGASGTKPGGGNPNFSSLKAACDSLNANTGRITGACTFLITSNLTESANVGLGCQSGGYTITFKPAPGVSPVITFTKTADNSGVSGAWVIGSSDLTKSTAVTVNNVVIDGSNASGGSTRDLTIATAAACNGNTVPLKFYGDVNSSVVKNCIIKPLQAVSYALLLTVRAASGTSYVPDDITIENCAIANKTGASGQAVAISNSGTPTVYPTGIAIRNNLLEAAYRGIFLNYAGDTEISGNEVRITQSNSGSMSYGIHGSSIGAATNTTTICNNRLTCLSIANCTAGGDAGITGIHCGSKGSYHVYNNMISGFAVAGPDVPMKVVGIRATVSANVSFNSIYMCGLARAVADSMAYCGIYTSAGTAVVKNNIIASHDNVDSSFGIVYGGGNLNADYNIYQHSGAKGCTGLYKNIPRKNLSDWQSASGGDAHSKSADPAAVFGASGNWMSATDLHWHQVPSVQFAGVAITGITADADGHARHTIPTMGADESDVALPVELRSFIAESRGGAVVLRWTTASEVNTHGFDVERKVPCTGPQTVGASRDWSRAGFVHGNGTTNLPHDYEFLDTRAEIGMWYRLKQIDNDGAVRYSPEIAAPEAAVQGAFTLWQNYPNPFNPGTEIKFTIPAAVRVRLGIYDAAGREAARLVDAVLEQGTHAVVWDARDFAAGIYFCRLQAGLHTSVKKLVIIK